MPRADGPAGFTLIEVLVALALGSLVVLMAHQAFGAAQDLRDRLDTSIERHERAMRVREYLTLMFVNLEIGTPTATGFEGAPERAAFTSRVARTTGDDAPVRIEVRVEGGWLFAVAGGDTLRLERCDRGGLDYLPALGAATPWVREWHSPVSAPVAARLRVARMDGAAVDTLLFLIGTGG